MDDSLQEFRRLITVKLPLPVDLVEEHFNIQDLVVMRWDNHGEWLPLEVSYRFTKNSVSFDTRILSRWMSPCQRNFLWFSGIQWFQCFPVCGDFSLSVCMVFTSLLSLFSNLCGKVIATEPQLIWEPKSYLVVSEMKTGLCLFQVLCRISQTLKAEENEGGLQASGARTDKHQRRSSAILTSARKGWLMNWKGLILPDFQIKQKQFSGPLLRNLHFGCAQRIFSLEKILTASQSDLSIRIVFQAQNSHFKWL